MIHSGSVLRVHGFDLGLRADHLGHSLQTEVSKNAYARICSYGFSTHSFGGIMVRHLLLDHCQGVEYWLQIVKTPSGSGSHMYRG